MKLSADRAGLVMDLGVSEGNDTAFYLAKGFQVIAVEANAVACAKLRERFADDIEAGDLKILNFAASDNFGELLVFYAHPEAAAISGIAKRNDVSDTYDQKLVQTIDWNTLVAQSGLPRYLKIDIEGNEGPFLQSMLGSRHLPEFVSVEVYKLQPILLLHALGYRRFKLVDQNPPGGFKLPDHQVEGTAVVAPNFTHCSGPFGLDLFTADNWIGFEEVQEAWKRVHPEMARTWFDCHAWKPN